MSRENAASMRAALPSGRGVAVAKVAEVAEVVEVAGVEVAGVGIGARVTGIAVVAVAVDGLQKEQIADLPSVHTTPSISTLAVDPSRFATVTRSPTLTACGTRRPHVPLRSFMKVTVAVAVAIVFFTLLSAEAAWRSIAGRVPLGNSFDPCAISVTRVDLFTMAMWTFRHMATWAHGHVDL